MLLCTLSPQGLFIFTSPIVKTDIVFKILGGKMDIEENELLEMVKVKAPWYMMLAFYAGYFIDKFLRMMVELCQKLK